MTNLQDKKKQCQEAVRKACVHDGLVSARNERQDLKASDVSAAFVVGRVRSNHK
jgi:hypothetical protein